MRLIIPSKTFLLGEYIALNGGPTLIACTKPQFEINISLNSSNTILNIHSESPAGKLMAAYPHIFATMHFEFYDPHQSSGGFGASSAQFLACYSIMRRSYEPQWQFTSSDIPELLATYRQFAWNGHGQAPSGADVIAQTQTGICYFNRHQLQLESYGWPFTNYALLLIKTGFKVATHQHLANLPSLPELNLTNTVLQARQAMLENQAPAFIAAINSYAHYLAEANLTLASTINMLDLLRSHPACVAAKGCGALGADVIVAIIENHSMREFCRWLDTHSLQLIASDADL